MSDVTINWQEVAAARHARIKELWNDIDVKNEFIVELIELLSSDEPGLEARKSAALARYINEFSGR